MKKLFLVASLTLFPLTTYAQTAFPEATIQGVVEDKTSFLPK